MFHHTSRYHKGVTYHAMLRMVFLIDLNVFENLIKHVLYSTCVRVINYKCERWEILFLLIHCSSKIAFMILPSFLVSEISDPWQDDPGDHQFYLFVPKKELFKVELGQFNHKRQQISKMQKISLNMCEKFGLCTFLHIWEIWRLLQKAGRFCLYLTDFWIIWVSWHRC